MRKEHLMETSHTTGTAPAETQIAAVLNRMRGAYDTYAALIAASDEAAAHRQPAAGEWSAVEVIAHLADLDQFNRTERYNAILMTESPQLPAYDPDARNAAGNHAAMSTTDVLAFFKAERDALLMLLEGLRPHEWARIGIHPRWGAQTLYELVARTPDHDEMHVGQAQAALGGQ